MAQDQWTLQEKKRSQKPVHRPPLQARVVAANRTVLTTCDDDPGAHGNEQGAKAKLNGGKRWCGQWAWHGKGEQASKACRTRPLQANTAGGQSDGTGLKATQQPAVGRPRSKTMAADDVGRALAVQCR